MPTAASTTKPPRRRPPASRAAAQQRGGNSCAAPALHFAPQDLYALALPFGGALVGTPAFQRGGCGCGRAVPSSTPLLTQMGGCAACGAPAALQRGGGGRLVNAAAVDAAVAHLRAKHGL
jgi:hypothetical protein